VARSLHVPVSVSLCGWMSARVSVCCRMGDVSKYLGIDHQHAAKVIVGINRKPGLQSSGSASFPRHSHSVNCSGVIPTSKAENFAKYHNVPLIQVNISDDKEISACFELVVREELKQRHNKQSYDHSDSVDVRTKNGSKTSWCSC